MQPEGFGLPWQVRYVRAWWLREGRWHLRASRHGHRAYHLRLAAEAKQYAKNIRDRWIAKGEVPLVAQRSEAEALPLKPHPIDGRR